MSYKSVVGSLMHSSETIFVNDFRLTDFIIVILFQLGNKSTGGKLDGRLEIGAVPQYRNLWVPIFLGPSILA